MAGAVAGKMVVQAVKISSLVFFTIAGSLYALPG